MEPFWFGKHLEPFLFSGWNVQTVKGIVLVCLVLAVFAMLLEAIKAMRVYLLKESSRSPLNYARTEQNINERSALLAPLLIPSSKWQIRKRRLKYHVCESLLYLTQVLTGYLLMLAVMSYNAWIIISVAIGSAIGYFVMGAVRNRIAQAAEREEVCSAQSSAQTSQNQLEDIAQYSGASSH